MSALTIVLFVIGLAALGVGAEALVRGASRLARSVGISPLVVGLTVVAYGTSSPEVAVSLMAVFEGRGDLSIGNVVGSNIFNTLAILGISAAIAPLAVSRQLVRLDAPLVVGASALVYLFALNGTLSRIEGILLLVGAVGYSAFLIWLSRREAKSDAPAEPSNGDSAWLRQIGYIGVGLGLLVLGSNLLVDSATTIARAFGLSELIIGLTIVAAGTSLPELAASVMATARGERDIAVGNVIGSNIFNLLLILGLSASVSPSGGIAVNAGVVGFDLPVMLAVAVACLPIFFTGHRIDRWEGFVFLAYYVVYIAYLILDATDHDQLPLFSLAMWAFALPLTALTLTVVMWRAVGARRSGASG